MRGSLFERVTRRLDRHNGRGRTCDGALSYAAFAAGNSDDLFDVRDAALRREPATRHHRGFATFWETL